MSKPEDAPGAVDATLDSDERPGLAATIPGHTTGAAASSPQAIGRFEIERKLGEGGMGVVMLATDPVLGRRVALKLLHRDRAEVDGAHARFLREAQAMAQLSHENVIVVHEVGTHEGKVYLAMEYVDGQTLGHWQVGRSWSDILERYVRAGRGLEAAHKAGLVHRDFKPDNVLVGDDKIRVTDFGLVSTSGTSDLSRTVESLREKSGLAQSLTHTGTVMGTPRYMSPEQHLGEPVDLRADQFSFCVALFEALYGKPPFAGTTFSQIASNVLEGRLSPVPDDSPVPASVRDALLRGLRRERDERFATMGELLEALTAAPAAAAPRPRRRPWWIAGIALAGVLAIGLAVWAVIEMRAARDRASQLDRELVSLKQQFSGSAGSGSPTALAEAQRAFERGQSAYMAKHYEEASEQFLAAYRARPYAQFLYNAAAAYHMEGKSKSDPQAYRRAIELYRRYLAAAPEADDRDRVTKAIGVLGSEADRLEQTGNAR